MNKRFYIIYIIFIILISSVSAGKVTYILPMTCQSQSMAPTIQCGDKVYAQTVSSSSLISVGDIVCFNPDYRYFNKGGYRYVCHRVMDIDKSGKVLTRGDANSIEDYYIARYNIAFIVTKVVKV